MAQRVVKIGRYYDIKGFHDTQGVGIEDEFLKAATQLFKAELGSAVVIVSVNDYLSQDHRQKLLAQLDRPDIDLIFSS